MNTEFIFTLVTSFLIFYIGIITVFHNRKDVTSKFFALISIATVVWAFSNYFSLRPVLFPTIIWSRLVLFFAVPHVLLFYFFLKNFPKPDLVIPKKQIFILGFLATLIMAFTLTPFIFKGLNYNKDIPSPIPGVLMPVFGIFIVSILIASLVQIIKKYRNVEGKERKSWGVMLFGFAFSYISLIFTNFILVNTMGDTRFILFAPLLMLPSILGSSYSIMKYRLFNVKAIATELIVFVLLSVSLTQIVLADSTMSFIFNLSTFLMFLIASVLLIKSVYKEVEQREKLEILDKELEKSNSDLGKANEKLKSLDKLKTEFVSLASHQLRSPLTAIKGYASMLIDGDYGDIGSEAKEAIDRMYQSSKNLTVVVEDLLNVTKIESGGMKFEMTPFDLSQVAEDEFKDFTVVIEKKGLKLSFEKDDSKLCMVNGDKEKIRQIVINFIDNSVKYTKEGSIDISVRNKNNKVIFCVKDTGMGMTEEIKESLFQKFARGDGARMNTTGTGLGLYLAKQIAEAHKGRVWVESDGPGKGSAFFMELNAECFRVD